MMRQSNRGQLQETLLFDGGTTEQTNPFKDISVPCFDCLRGIPRFLVLITFLAIPTTGFYYKYGVGAPS